MPYRRPALLAPSYAVASSERAVDRAIDGLDIAWVAVPAAELRNVNTHDDLGSL